MWYSDIKLVVCAIIALIALTAYVMYRYNKLTERYEDLNEQYESKCRELDRLIDKFDEQLTSWTKEAISLVDMGKLKQEIEKLKY